MGVIAIKQRVPRRLERQLRGSLATIYVLLPECHVCGKRMEPEFLKPFPGAPEVDKACPECRGLATVEVPTDVHDSR